MLDDRIRARLEQLNQGLLPALKLPPTATPLQSPRPAARTQAAGAAIRPQAKPIEGLLQRGWRGSMALAV